VGHAEGLRGYAGSVAKDASAGRGGEHDRAQAVDKVGGCGRFAEGCDEVCEWHQQEAGGIWGKWKVVPPRRGLMKDPTAEPKASAPRSRVVRGTWPS